MALLRGFQFQDPTALHWAVPVIQGYCKISRCENTFEVDEGEEITDIQRMPLPAEEFELILISRRSVRRAGQSTGFMNLQNLFPAYIHLYFTNQSVVQFENNSKTLL